MMVGSESDVFPIEYFLLKQSLVLGDIRFFLPGVYIESQSFHSIQLCQE